MSLSLHGEAALAYAARGWRVVPTHEALDDGSCTCRKGRECPKAGKHPRVTAWQEVATTDTTVITAWWTEWPASNVSIVTGGDTGMFVIDVDPGSGGFESIDEYEEMSQFGLPRTLKAVTGSGGWHLFYRLPPGVVVRNIVGLMPGVDVRGEGGQVVAPPSRHKTGGFYTWADCWVEGPQDAPEELLRLVLRAEGTAEARGGSGVAGDLPSSAEILAGVPEGERNDTLFRWACQLRRKLNDDRSAVTVLVVEAAKAAGLEADEVRSILESAFKQDHEDTSYGLSEGQIAWANEAAALSSDGVIAGLGATGGLVGETGTLALPLTDDGNSLRFVRDMGHGFRYVPQSGQWLVWDGKRWAPCEVLQHEAAAVAVARGIWREVADIEDKDTRKQVENWARGSQMRGKIEAMLAMTRSKLAVSMELLDADDWALNIKNGTLNLRTGTLKPHDPKDLLTAYVDTAYDPAARADKWRAFLEMVVPDANVRWFLQKAVGYSLTGVTDAKAMFILYGAGSNGKSVFLEAIKDNVIGSYAGVAPKTLVMAERDEHATQLAGMAGKRFVTLSEEVEEKDKLRTSTLKSITGGDMMTARFMRQDFFDFQPKLKLWIGTNHRPGLAEFGEAMRTRLRLVPFTVRIPEEARRPREDVLAEFAMEADGILAWAVEGLAGWLKEGLEPPSAMQEAVGEWFNDEDVFGQWVEERGVMTSTEYFYTSQSLHQDYAMWMTMRGEERWIMSPKSFGRRMMSAGFHNGAMQKKKGWFVQMNGAVNHTGTH